MTYHTLLSIRVFTLVKSSFNLERKPENISAISADQSWITKSKFVVLPDLRALKGAKIDGASDKEK